MNHVTLSGTVFQPESRVAKSGMAVLTFRLSYYQSKGKDGKATYGGIDVTVFDRLAQAWDGQLHDKDKVIVTGHITLDKWEKDGKKYYKHRLGQQHGCRKCAFYDHEAEACRISGCGPAAWSIGSGSDDPGRKGA